MKRRSLLLGSAAVVPSLAADGLVIRSAPPSGPGFDDDDWIFLADDQSMTLRPFPELLPERLRS